MEESKIIFPVNAFAADKHQDGLSSMRRVTWKSLSRRTVVCSTLDQNQALLICSTRTKRGKGSHQIILAVLGKEASKLNHVVDQDEPKGPGSSRICQASIEQQGANLGPTTPQRLLSQSP